MTLRRIPYDTSNNEVADEVEQSAIPALNAESTGAAQGNRQGTRLWWDVKDRKRL